MHNLTDKQLLELIHAAIVIGQANPKQSARKVLAELLEQIDNHTPIKIKR